MAKRTSAALLAMLIAAPAGLALAQTAPAPAATAAPEATAPAAVAPVTTPPAADATAAAPTPETAPSAATDAATPAAPASTPAETAAPAEGTQTAAPATPDDQQPGTYYAKSTHGDWTLRCMRTADGKDPCELYQLLKDDKGVAVAEVSAIPFDGDAAALINFVAPLETDLNSGLGLQIDAGKNNAFPFIVCAPIGCISRIGLTAEELAAMKKGNKATVSLLPFGGTRKNDTVKLDVSLKGFTAGFDALKAQPAADGAAKP